MSNEEFRKKITIRLVIFLIAVGLVLGMVYYTFFYLKANLSIAEDYNANDTDVDLAVSKNYLETKGIDKDELEKYLAVITNLKMVKVPKDIEASEAEKKDNYMKVTTAINLLKEVKGEEIDINETTGDKTYSKEKIHGVLKELLGMFIKENVNVENYYELNEENNYVIKKEDNTLSHLVELEDVNINYDIITAKFKSVFGTNEEISKLMNNEKIRLQTYEYRVELKMNSKYDYSKYYVVSVEQIGKEEIEYNNTSNE